MNSCQTKQGSYAFGVLITLVSYVIYFNVVSYLGLVMAVQQQACKILNNVSVGLLDKVTWVNIMLVRAHLTVF